MKQNFEDLFRYNFEANRRVLEAVLSTPNIAQKAHDVCGHMLVAHQIWLSRIASKPADQVPMPWSKIAPEDYLRLNQQLFEDTLAVIDSEDFGRNIHYSNTKGASFANSVLEILNHLLLHSSYHRGQANMLIRQSDGEPAVSDYIIYKREL